MNDQVLDGEDVTSHKPPEKDVSELSSEQIDDLLKVRVCRRGGGWVGGGCFKV